MTKHIRDREELITLQDKAIVALQQANLALQLALDALQRARNELGYVHPIPFVPAPLNPAPNISAPYWQGVPYMSHQTWTGVVPPGFGSVSGISGLQSDMLHCTASEVEKFKALYQEYDKKKKQ